jgi:hypothetical protein
MDSTIVVKLVLLGDTAVGKSCLVVRFVRDEFFEFQEPTIGGEAPLSLSLGSRLGVNGGGSSFFSFHCVMTEVGAFKGRRVSQNYVCSAFLRRTCFISVFPLCLECKKSSILHLFLDGDGTVDLTVAVQYHDLILARSLMP